MSVFRSVLFGLMLLISILISLDQMGDALDEADMGGFYIWTCVASIIAGLPILL